MTPYDVNFCFSVRELENDRVKLTPFIPALHSDLFFQGSSPHPELYQHFPIGPYPSAAAFTQHLVLDLVQRDPGMTLYVIIDKTKTSLQGSPSSADLAGVIGYIYGSPTHLSIEIALVIILPPFQRTHVTTNAVGLLLRYALDLPTATSPGLGLRRVQWQASENNMASIRVAERMGFKKEATLRWEEVFNCSAGKVGIEYVREGDSRSGTLGLHLVMLAICWDDWESGWRERVAALMERQK